MASRPRVVAELGRPETPGETAARKAASSRAYRSSQTFRNLIVALLVTLVVVAVIVFGVPRGSLPEHESIDVAAAAEAAEAGLGHTLVSPATPEGWRANVAQFEASAWIVTFTPDVFAPDEGFVRIAQGLGADDSWVSRAVGGYAPTGSVTIDGIVWDEYDLPRSSSTLTYALSTQAGDDIVLISGPVSADDAAMIASALTADVQTLRGETE